MSEFQTALDFVDETLRELREQGVELRASMEALGRLETVVKEGVGSPVRDSREPAVAAPVVAGREDTDPFERYRAGGAASLSGTASDRPNPREPAVVAAAKVAEVPPEVVAAQRDELVRVEFTGKRMAPAEGTKTERLGAMRGPVLACTKCPHLVKSRTQVVFGVGNPEAELMFVGEAPGEDEDHEGEPFVGKAGQLLTKIIETMGFPRSEVYIANVLKCRPDMPKGMPGNRKPKPEEMEVCLPYLREQIDIIRPRVLVALGNTAMEGLTGTKEPMARLRGRWHDFQGTPLMATYHPAYLLRNQAQSEKRKVWEDMLLVLGKLGKVVSEKQKGYFLSK